MRGANIRDIQELLGHKDIRITMKYSHLSRKHLRSVVNVLNEWSEIGTNLAQERFVKKLRVHRCLKNKGGLVAQLDRAADFESEGWEFKSPQAY